MAVSKEILGEILLVEIATDGASISKPLRTHNPFSWYQLENEELSSDR